MIISRMEYNYGKYDNSNIEAAAYDAGDRGDGKPGDSGAGRVDDDHGRDAAHAAADADDDRMTLAMMMPTTMTQMLIHMPTSKCGYDSIGCDEKLEAIVSHLTAQAGKRFRLKPARILAFCTYFRNRTRVLGPTLPTQESFKFFES